MADLAHLQPRGEVAPLHRGVAGWEKRTRPMTLSRRSVGFLSLGLTCHEEAVSPQLCWRPLLEVHGGGALVQVRA